MGNTEIIVVNGITYEINYNEISPTGEPVIVEIKSQVEGNI